MRPIKNGMPGGTKATESSLWPSATTRGRSTSMVKMWVTAWYAVGDHIMRQSMPSSVRGFAWVRTQHGSSLKWEKGEWCSGTVAARKEQHPRWQESHWELPLVECYGTRAKRFTAVRPIEGPNAWGKQYLWPFMSRGACFRSQQPEDRKISVSAFYITGVYTPL